MTVFPQPLPRAIWKTYMDIIGFCLNFLRSVPHTLKLTCNLNSVFLSEFSELGLSLTKLYIFLESSFVCHFLDFVYITIQNFDHHLSMNAFFYFRFACFSPFPILLVIKLDNYKVWKAKTLFNFKLLDLCTLWLFL